MKFINRFALTLHYKQAYLDWYNSIFPDEAYLTVDAINETEKTVSLIPAFEEDEEIEEFLREHFEQFFEAELFAVCMEEKHWAKDRTWEKFMEWFDPEISPMVIDYGKEELVDEDDSFTEFWDEEEEEEEHLGEDGTVKHSDFDEDGRDNIRRLPKPPLN